MEEKDKKQEMNPEEKAEDMAGETVPEASAEEAETEKAEETQVSEEEASESGDEPENGAQNEKKGFFKKKEKKDKKDQQIADLTDRLQRTMAEFDNYRKRTEKEKASMYIIGAKEIIEKILPVVDNFERGLATAQEGDAFADGMKMIYKQMMTTLDDLGVKAIDAVGQPFDPNFHNAVMHVDDESLGENVVAEELQKGYTYKDFVIRHSMVKVAN